MKTCIRLDSCLSFFFGTLSFMVMIGLLVLTAVFVYTNSTKEQSTFGLAVALSIFGLFIVGVLVVYLALVYDAWTRCRRTRDYENLDMA